MSGMSDHGETAVTSNDTNINRKDNDDSSNHQVCGAFSFLWPRKRTPVLTLVNPYNYERNGSEVDDNDVGDESVGRASFDDVEVADDTTTTTTSELITCLGSMSMSSSRRRTPDTNNPLEVDTDTAAPTSSSPHRSSSWLSFFATSSVSPDASALQSTSNATTSSSGWLPGRVRLTTTVLDYTEEELLLSDSIATVESDLSWSCLEQRHGVWIVTTAAVPWMTGTAINPMLRAAHLALYYHHHSSVSENDKSDTSSPRTNQTTTVEETTTTTTLSNAVVVTAVHLVLPWLTSAQDRLTLYGPEWEHVDCHVQEAYVQNWMQQHVPNYGKSSSNNSIHNNNDTDNGGDDDDLGARVHIHWYPARYHAALGSIFALGDICSRLPVRSSSRTNDQTDDDDHHRSRDICILEEPEHLNYYRGGHWRTRFAHVIGIIHTNYCEYAKQSILPSAAAPLVGAVSAWMVQAYCDKVIQLSATLPSYAPEKEVVCNVHGVRAEFLTPIVSNESSLLFPPPPPRANDTDIDCNESSSLDESSRVIIYFLGKLLWAKGLDKLWQLQHVWKQQTQLFFPMDIYGSGADKDDIQRAFAAGGEGRTVVHGTNGMGATDGGVRSCRSYSELVSSTSSSWWPSSSNSSRTTAVESTTNAADAGMPVRFLGHIDHAVVDQNRSCRYKIFVNPSVSEVLCTATAEATAMGNKFVIIPHHPSNDFFVQFPNCLLYKDDEDFVSHLQYALTHEPVPLSTEHQTLLTWEGATERFIRAACISHREAARRDRLRVRDQRLADWHIKMGQGTTGDVLRQFLGGGPVAKQSLYEDEKPKWSSSVEDDATIGTVVVPNLSRSSSASSTGSASPVVVLATKRRSSIGHTLWCQGHQNSPPLLAL